jgi:hypothetical protein
MEQNKKLKLFISYSHQDNIQDKPYIDKFKKHIMPLKNNGLIEDWYDRKILPGEYYQDKIDNNLEDADIICLFISSNFLASESCMKEKNKAVKLKNNNGIALIPIILTHCGWKDDDDISKLLVLPTDGKPVSTFLDQEEAWHYVYEGLKKIIEKIKKIKNLKMTEEFEDFLQDTEMLTKAHSRKERVIMDDIYIHPELDKYDDFKKNNDKIISISSEELLNTLLEYTKIAIAGEDQSGKTALCKVIFKEYLKKNFIPVYVSDKVRNFSGKIENRILKSFREQYVEVDITEIDGDRIVLIIDDFHFAKNKGKHINDISKYSHCVVIIDDIFRLNIMDEKLIGQFSYFKIRELNPSLRYELIKKWVILTDKESGDTFNENNLYKIIDKNTELIDSILGKTIGRGIMPAYPFFILSSMVTYETFRMPLDQEITSQGYCYQALIYFYLRRKGVKSDEIDIYINFLTEVAFYFYREKKDELSPVDFNSFMRFYLEKYHLPIKQDTLVNNLKQIFPVSSINNYFFRYPYLYYFFVAKFLADHVEDSEIKVEIDRVVNNLHVNENSYIAIFTAHHSRNIKILEEIELNAICLFDKYKAATLTKSEIKFFDEKIDYIIKAALLSNNSNITAEQVRSKNLKIREKIEQSKEITEIEEDINNEDSFGIELRRAIRTVEVMGHIIKNRAGSLERKKLLEIFEEAMNIYLRILSSFFEIIKGEDEEKAIIDFISNRLEKIIEKKKERPSREEMEKISRIIFWNLNFFIVYGFIDKIVHSLGSDKLTEIVNKVCNEIKTPASFLVKHGILMWYKKNIEVNEIARELDMKDFSEVAKRVMKLMIVDHCSLHSINYKDKQRIESKLRISTRKILKKD